MQVLCAHNFVGEVGWEFFCHQARLRKLSKEYDKTVVVCRSGHEVLYTDFAEVIPEAVPSEECDMWSCRGYKHLPDNVMFGHVQGEKKIVKPPLCRYDHTHKLDYQPLFNLFKEQEFVPYGKVIEPTWDIIIHARSKKNKVNARMNSDYRNWPAEKWKIFVEKLSKFKIACIGTKDSALYVGGNDLRGVPLTKVCDIIASSKVVVGPSSGPMHLAALCKTPHVVWYGPPYDKKNEIRYTKDWNPFKTRAEVLRDDNWDVEVYEVIRTVYEILQER